MILPTAVGGRLEDVDNAGDKENENLAGPTMPQDDITGLGESTVYMRSTTTLQHLLVAVVGTISTQKAEPLVVERVLPTPYAMVMLL